MGIFDFLKRKDKNESEIIVNPISNRTSSAFDRLYDYQRDAIAKTTDESKGIICMPTGVGKTFCQAAIIADDILNNPKEFRMYVVNAPRIMLSYQLLKEVYGFLMKEGIEARYMFVHSGGKTDEKELEAVRLASRDIDGNQIPFAEIGSGTSSVGIKDMMYKAKSQNLPLIFFSTYNSADRIEDARKSFLPEKQISIVLNDEAHYLVQEQFHDILSILKSDRCYFFTATMIYTPSIDKGRGMNNAETYGNVLYVMTPKQAIDMGKMVRPRLHYVVTDGIYNADDYNKSLNKIIADTFKQHEEVLVATNQCPKILISTKGTQDIIDFLESKQYKQLRAEGVDIYAVASSDEVGNRVNEKKESRQDFLKMLKADGENRDKKLIVLHYDILAEGIDVSGFTGIMPLRTLNKSKFIQTFGRSARPDKEDRKKIDSKEITVDDLVLMNKPFAYIIIPTIIKTNEDDKANLEALIKELRSEFGYNPSEYILSSEQKHGVRKRELGGDEILIGGSKVGKNIEDINYRLEQLEQAILQANLSPEELLRKKYNLK